MKAEFTDSQGKQFVKPHHLSAKSMSLSSPKMAEQMRKFVQDSIEDDTYVNPSLTDARNSLVLPSFVGRFPAAIRSYLYWRLLDVDRLRTLQDSGALNSHKLSERVWIWEESGEISVRPPRGTDQNATGVCCAMLVVNTIGDGSCLLHAVSLSLWGIQDRVGTLRKALGCLLRKQSKLFKECWKTQEKVWDGMDAALMGLLEPIERSEDQWAADWSDVQDRAEKDGAFLTQIHLFVLAHVIRRALVVFAPTEENNSPCRFRGVYLPLAWPSQVCEKAPLFLAFQGSHFVSLCHHDQVESNGAEARAASGPPRVPLMAGDEALPVLYSGTPGSQHLKLLQEYLPIVPLEGGGHGVLMDLPALRERATNLNRSASDLGDRPSGKALEHLIKQYIEEGKEEYNDKTAATTPGGRPGSLKGCVPELLRSDSQLARQLQDAEWGITSLNIGMA